MATSVRRRGSSAPTAEGGSGKGSSGGSRPQPFRHLGAEEEDEDGVGLGLRHDSIGASMDGSAPPLADTKKKKQLKIDASMNSIDTGSPASPHSPQAPPFGGRMPPQGSFATTSYTVYKSSRGVGGALRRRRSETGEAILVPCLLCGAFGPLCWLMGASGWGVHNSLWLSVLIVYAICQLRERLRRTAKLEADRLAFRRRVLQEDETAEWWNTIMAKIWIYHEPLLAQKMKAALLETLSELKPSRIQSFDIVRFTLGKRAPFMQSARIITRGALDMRIPDDRIVLSTVMGWQAPHLDIVILARTSVGTIPIKIRDFWMHGKMRLEIDLVPQFPHTQSYAFTFLETPVVDFEITPMGVNLMEVPYVASYIQTQMVKSINEAIVEPARVVFHNIRVQREEEKVDCAEGILFVALLEVRLPARSNLIVGTSDYFCKLQLGPEVMFTRAIQRETTPEDAANTASHSLHWTESFALLTGAGAGDGNPGVHEPLELQVKQTRARTSRTVSTLKLPLDDVLKASETQFLTYPLEGVGGTKQEGQVTLGLRYRRLPELILDKTKSTVIHRVNERTLSPVNANKEAGLLQTDDHPYAGSLVLIIHSAADLRPMDADGLSDPYALVYYGDREVLRTKPVPKTLEPTWEASREFTVQDLRRVRFTVRLFDMDSTTEDDELGDVDLDVMDALSQEAALHLGRRATRVHKRWFNLRKPGPLAERKELTAAELKQQRKAGGEAPADKGRAGKRAYGFLCVSLLFRPLPAAAVPRGFQFQAALGNQDEDVTMGLDCYNASGGGSSKAPMSTSAAAGGAVPASAATTGRYQGEALYPGGGYSSLRGRTGSLGGSVVGGGGAYGANGNGGAHAATKAGSSKTSYFTRFLRRPGWSTSGNANGGGTTLN